MRTSTSPACGPCRSTCSICSGWPAANATAARVFIAVSPSGVECGGVMPQVIFDERLHEVVIVTVAFAPAQIERLAGLLARGLEQIRTQAGQMRVLIALIDQDRAGKLLLQHELARVVSFPGLAV